MNLPSDSTRSRILWSIVAALIIAIWTIGILGAQVTARFGSYTFLEVLEKIVHPDQHGFWPGAFRFNARWHEQLIQISPLLAMAVWPLCLIRWRSRWLQVLVLSLAILIPSGILLVQPVLIFTLPFRMAPMLVTSSQGKYWQDEMVGMGAMALWWWFLLPAVVGSLIRQRRLGDDCPVCSYSTTGLTSAICPECGNPLPISSQ